MKLFQLSVLAIIIAGTLSSVYGQDGNSQIDNSAPDINSELTTVSQEETIVPRIESSTDKEQVKSAENTENGQLVQWMKTDKEVTNPTDIQGSERLDSERVAQEQKIIRELIEKNEQVIDAQEKEKARLRARQNHQLKYGALSAGSFLCGLTLFLAGCGDLGDALGYNEPNQTPGLTPVPAPATQIARHKSLTFFAFNCWMSSWIATGLLFKKSWDFYKTMMKGA